MLLLAMMVALVRRREPVPRGFFEIIGWRWPRRTWLRFVLAGIVLAIVIQLASQWLPIPPSLPIEKFFQTRTYAYLMAGFGILIAPAIEELYFRGFLYPVLARALGMVAGVAMTSFAFTLLHGLQLSFSWAAMLMIFIVGLALTLVRAWTRSVAAGVLLHMSYNGTLFAFAFIASDGFRHLEKV
jgi:membrane protease YdiL (CAAX protease family)